ncbi:hypothetical protein HT031_000281 [Scenedesmus sp. PABB004]|nr:hypothetical protein HT031_000281 [Scenedesmus sp. PABB004]
MAEAGGAPLPLPLAAPGAAAVKQQHQQAPGAGPPREAVRQHKRVPRWLRMSLRTSVMIGLVALPALAVKEPSFERLFRFKGYSIVFMVLGTLVLPMWEPNLGKVVLAFTLLMPVGCASLWLAYGLFLGCPSIIFMMGACVVVTGLVFFFSELLGLPVALLSVFATLFCAAATSFVGTPRMALPMTALLSVLLVVAAVLSTLVCWLVFPEFCVDEVFRFHHEGLEHLLQLAHHALGGTAPPLLRRAQTAAPALEAGGEWRRLLAAADELPVEHGELTRMRAKSAVSSDAAAAAAAAADPDEQAARVERSLQRIVMALQEGAAAQVGAKAEVVLAAVAHKRVIVPCTPLLPCARGQMDEAALLALRHVAVATSTQIHKVFAATHPLDEPTAALMGSLRSSAQWRAMGAALQAALQELVETFPMDYYPSPAAPSQACLAAFRGAVAELDAAWRAARAQAAGGGGAAAAPPSPQGGGAAGAHPAAGAVADVFHDPLVPAGSPAAEALAWMNALVLVGMLDELGDLLAQLFSAARAAADSVLRFKCC